jgi:hypothetical protein
LFEEKSITGCARQIVDTIDSNDLTVRVEPAHKLVEHQGVSNPGHPGIMSSGLPVFEGSEHIAKAGDERHAECVGRLHSQMTAKLCTRIFGCYDYAGEITAHTNTHKSYVDPLSVVKGLAVCDLYADVPTAVSRPRNSDYP